MQVDTIPGLDRAMASDRLYCVQSHEGFGFRAGRTASGQQLLAAVDDARLLVVLFNEVGELSDTVRVLLPSSPSAHSPEHTALSEYLSEKFGYEDCRIRVKCFRVDLDDERRHNPLQRALIGEPGLSVAPFPTVFQQFLDDPAGCDSEDYTSYREMLTRWISEGNFVLYWGNEYHLNPDGVVIAT